MSKRSRRMKTTRDGRMLIIPDKRDLAREQEILAKPSNAFYGTVVERMMDRLHQPDCTNEEAVRIGLAVQQLLRGDAALLNNMNNPAVSEQVAHLQEQAAAEDRANQEWEQNQEKFVDRVFDKADKLIPTGAKKEQLIAQGMQGLANARAVGKARVAAQKVEFARRMAGDPKVEVMVEPEYINTTVNGVVTMMEVKPTLKIMDKTFALDTGRQYLPKILAERYWEHLRTVRENRDRQKVMAAWLERDQYEAEMRRIDREYNSPRDAQNQVVM